MMHRFAPALDRAADSALLVAAVAVTVAVLAREAHRGLEASR